MNISKKLLALTCVLSFCILLCSCGSKVAEKANIPQVSGSFNVNILKAGQADAIIMKTQNHSVIIDVGEKDDGDEIVSFAKNNNIESIDYLFITHFDKDHVGGLPELAQNISIENIIVPNYEGTSDEYYAYVETVKSKNLTLTVVNEDADFVIDDVLFEVSTPEKSFYAEGDNDYSLVISVTHGENTFLFAGDAEADRIPEVLSQFGTKYDFLKVPHHGKYNKNTKRFINTIKPQYAVICDSAKNPASDKVLSLLESAKSNIYCTKDGDVSVVSNGTGISVTQ